MQEVHQERAKALDNSCIISYFILPLSYEITFKKTIGFF